MPKKARVDATVDDRYMTAQQVAARFNISRRSVDNWVNSGKLPQPRKFTERTVLYARVDIDAFCSAGAAA